MLTWEELRAMAGEWHVNIGSHGAAHHRLSQLSKNALKLGEGSVYPSLYRMEAKGWIKAEWAQSDNNRNAKYYALTKAGRKQLESEQ